MLIRECKKSDLGILKKIEKENMEKWVDKYYGKWQDTDFKGFTYVFTEHSEIIGFVNFNISGNTLHISSLQFDESHQGKGLGSEALAFVEEKARELKAGFITLSVFSENKNAVRLYQRQDFGLIENKGPKILMMKVVD